MEPGSLMQVKKSVEGQGDIGIVIGPSRLRKGCLELLFHDGIRNVHPSNLQKPDGRTKCRKDRQ